MMQQYLRCAPSFVVVIVSRERRCLTESNIFALGARDDAVVVLLHCSTWVYNINFFYQH
jgi:hypothetical protein